MTPEDIAQHTDIARELGARLPKRVGFVFITIDLAEVERGNLDALCAVVGMRRESMLKLAIAALEGDLSGTVPRSKVRREPRARKM